MPKVESLVRAPRLPRFILPGSFIDTLLVVSILDMIAICSKFCSSEGVNECFILGIKYCEKHDVIIKLTILGYASAQVFLSRCYNQFTKQTSLGEESFCSLTS